MENSAKFNKIYKEKICNTLNYNYLEIKKLMLIAVLLFYCNNLCIMMGRT